MSYTFMKSGALEPPSEQELLEADAQEAVTVKSTGVLADGTPYWAYVAVRPSKYKEFVEYTRQGKTIDLHQYGTVIKHGFDREVPVEIKEEMKRLHGYDDNHMDELRKDVVRERTVFLEKQESARIGDIVAMLKKNNS